MPTFSVSELINILEIVSVFVFVVILSSSLYLLYTGKIWPRSFVDKALKDMQEIGINSAREAGRMVGVEVSIAFIENLERITKNQDTIMVMQSSSSHKVKDMERQLKTMSEKLEGVALNQSGHLHEFARVYEGITDLEYRVGQVHADIKDIKAKIGINNRKGRDG